MKNIFYIVILNLLFMPTIFLGMDNNYAIKKAKKDNIFRKKMCGSFSSIPTITTFGQLFKSGFDIKSSLGISLLVGAGSFGICDTLTYHKRSINRAFEKIKPAPDQEK